jgi:hypothetical protein
MSLSTDWTRIKNAKVALKTAINGKGGTLDAEQIDAFPAAIDAIVTTAGTSDATATAGEILAPETAYIKGVKVTGIIPSKGAAAYTPTTSPQTVAAGQYLSGDQTFEAIPAAFKDTTGADMVAADMLSGKKGVNGMGLITGTIPSKSIATITPTTSPQIISAGQYLSGDQTVDAIPVVYKDTTGTDAVAAEIILNKKVVTGAGLVTGTMTDKSGTTQDAVAAIDTTYIALPIPATGYYNTLAKLRESFADLAALIGLTAAKLLTGNTIIGIAGSAVAQDDTYFIACITKATASVTLPAGLTTIGAYAFCQFAGLTISALPSGVTSIGTYAFDGCTNLALSALPSGVTSIGTYAFNSCTHLALTSLPTGLTSIAVSAFSSCTTLAFTSLPSGVTNINDTAFNNCINLALTALPSGVTSIGTYAFNSCTHLALTSLPTGLTSIAANAFVGCTALALTALPSGLTSINNSAFKGCTTLTKIWIPAACTTIAASSNSASPFLNCSAALKIYCETASKPAGWGAFWNYYGTGLLLTVNWSVTLAQFNAL